MQEDQYNYLKKLFVPLEIAKAVIDLGFDLPCFAFYTPLGGAISNLRSGASLEVMLKPEESVLDLAPLWEQVINWLREKHHIIIEPSYDFAETQTYNVALIQEGDNPIYHATDIIEEPDFYTARQKGVEQAILMIKDGTMDYIQFENWFTEVLDIWTSEGMIKRIALDKANAKLHYDLGETPEQYINQAKQDFK